MQERKSAEPKSHSELEKDELKKFQAEVATNPYGKHCYIYPSTSSTLNITNTHIQRKL